MINKQNNNKKESKMKTITITENLIPSLNLIRLDMIEKIEHLQETVEIAEGYSEKSQNNAIQDLDNFKLLYNKLFGCGRVA